jgi:hypothetical protein
MSKKNLTESEEILLGKFFDGEATLLERIRVKWLVDKNSNAARYLEQLESTNLLLKKIMIVPKVSLWSRVSANIHKAQRENQLESAQYHGFSKLKALAAIFLPTPVRYTVAGALAASTVFLMMPVTKNTSGIEIDYRSARNSRPISIQSVSGNSVYSQDARNVEWIRSSGTARRINSQSGRSPIVFIRPKTYSTESLPLLAERNSEGIVLKGNR